MSKILEEGYQCLIEFASRPTVKFYEIEVTPSEISVGSTIEVSTQRNAEWHTGAFSKLKKVGDMSIVGRRNRLVLDQVLLLLRVRDDA